MSANEALRPSGAALAEVRISRNNGIKLGYVFEKRRLRNSENLEV